MQLALIYFSSSQIFDFEFHPPAMDWTRRFSVAFKDRAASYTMTFSAFHLPLVFSPLLGYDISFQWDYRYSHIVTFVSVNTVTTNCLYNPNVFKRTLINFSLLGKKKPNWFSKKIFYKVSQMFKCFCFNESKVIKMRMYTLKRVKQRQQRTFEILLEIWLNLDPPYLWYYFFMYILSICY